MESKQPNTATNAVGASGSATRKHEVRWSVIDTVILLLVLVALAGIIYRVVISVSDEGDEGARYRVYFEVSETHREVLDQIQGFDEVYLVENDMLLGSIGATSVDAETGKGIPALTPINVEGTDMATATGCMVCRGVMSADSGLLVGDTERYLSLGSVLTVRTDRVILTIRITDIVAAP